MTKILDNGYLELVTFWGSDEAIIEAARMSTNKGFLGWGSEEKPGDEKLLAYLYRNQHMSPFEMAGATFEIKAPIFVFREWHRHRTQSYNEMSARYTPLPNENYIPSLERILMTSDKNKQAQSIGTKCSTTAAIGFQEKLKEEYDRQQILYESALQEGVPKELARLILPVGRYSKMRASANLRNWLQFLHLRVHESAQWEIRQYALAVQKELSVLFPKTLELFKG